MYDGPTISKLAESMVSLRGNRFSLDDYLLMIPFYDSKACKIIIMGGRQIGKTTCLAIKQVLKASLKKSYPILTIHPRASQSHRFSRLYVDPIIFSSDIIRQRVDTTRPFGKKSFFTRSIKEFNNNSTLFYFYIGDDPDRIRGIAAKDIYFDETQDLILDYIPVVEQCTSSFQDFSYVYAGTPKTIDNTMQILYKDSSQFEPFIKCESCNKENYCFIPDVYNMIKPSGLSCQKCGKIFNREDLVKNTHYKAMDPSKIGMFEGLHVPQIFVPYNITAKRWRKIILDYGTYNQYRFATEVLGISFDSGGRPVTLEKLMTLCTERKMGELDRSLYSDIFMGIDWGYATSDSYTVMTIVGLRHSGTYDVIYAKKFPFRDRLEQIREICSFFQSYGCKAVGADHGVGLTDNLELRAALGAEKVFEYHYCAPKEIVRYIPENMLYSTNRTRTIDLLFNDLNKGHIKFPAIEESKPFFEDILSVFEEVRFSPRGENKFYGRNKKVPDDFTHALNFAILTARILIKENIFEGVTE